MTSPEDLKLSICSNCDALFSTEYELLMHKNIYCVNGDKSCYISSCKNSYDKVHIGIDCKKDFWTNVEFENHKKMSHLQNTGVITVILQPDFDAFICHDNLASVSSQVNADMETHPDGENRSNFKEHNFKNMNNQENLEIEKSKRPKECPDLKTSDNTKDRVFVLQECEQNASQNNLFNSKIQKAAGGQPYLCKKCGMTFNKQSELKVHCWNHINKKPFECSECKECFPSRYSLLRHRTIFHLENSNECSQCGKVFIAQSFLERHMEIHRRSKQYQCEYCGKCLQRSTYKYHRLIHTGEKPHKCSICDKEFRRRSHLKRHLQIHGNELLV